MPYCVGLQSMRQTSVTLTRGALRFSVVAPVILCLCGVSPAICGGQQGAPGAPGMSEAQPHSQGWIARLYHRMLRFAGNARADSLRAMMINRPGLEGSAAWQGMGDHQPVQVESDGQRYWMATGRTLPKAHGLITLPPATPQGDYTYIWAASAADFPSVR